MLPSCQKLGFFILQMYKYKRWVHAYSQDVAIKWLLREVSLLQARNARCTCETTTHPLSCSFLTKITSAPHAYRFYLLTEIRVFVWNLSQARMAWSEEAVSNELYGHTFWAFSEPKIMQLIDKPRSTHSQWIKIWSSPTQTEFLLSIFLKVWHVQNVGYQDTTQNYFFIIRELPYIIWKYSGVACPRFWIQRFPSLKLFAT